MQSTTTYCLTKSDVEYIEILYKMKEKGLSFSLIPEGELMILHSKAKEKANS